jgi:hypothetical protein
MTEIPSRSRPRRATGRDQAADEASQPKRRGRRRLLKAAVAGGAAVVGASGYVAPSVRPLQLPVAHAFSF